MFRRFTLWVNGRRLSESFDTYEQATSHRDAISPMHDLWDMIEIVDGEQ